MKEKDAIVTIKIYYDYFSASLAQNKLLSRGIKSFIADENTIALNPLFGQALGGIRLTVFQTNLEDAKIILREMY